MSAVRVREAGSMGRLVAIVVVAGEEHSRDGVRDESRASRDKQDE